MVIQTFTGKKFDPLNPNINDFCIEDIAHSLSLQCRFTGHCRVFYSVAEHSVHVSYQVPIEHALWGLLHDASEAYLTDLSRPVKRIMPIYKQAEKRLQDLLIPFFGAELPTMQPECVTVADMRMLATERAQIMATGFEWEDLRGIDAYDLTLPCWGPLTAELAFLARFRQLTGK
jgi:hypothetical protein